MIFSHFVGCLSTFLMVSFAVQKFFFKILFIFRERREGEREGGKHQCMVASCAPLAGDLACNPGMCPDWELNQRPFSSQACAQSTELHQPGEVQMFLILMKPNLFFPLVARVIGISKKPLPNPRS